jgi:hypothetical protein
VRLGAHLAGLRFSAGLDLLGKRSAPAHGRCYGGPARPDPSAILVATSRGQGGEAGVAARDG